MSVVKSKRGTAKLEVITKARKLAAYSIRASSNDKYFPKRYRLTIANKITNCALNIMSDVRRANKIYVKDKSDYNLRKEYQNRALAETDALLGLIQIAYEMFNINSKKTKYWVGQIIEVEKLLRNWKKSDRARYKNVI